MFVRWGGAGPAILNQRHRQALGRRATGAPMARSRSNVILAKSKLPRILIATEGKPRRSRRRLDKSRVKATNLGTPEGPSQSAGPSEERQGSRSLRVFISYRRD